MSKIPELLKSISGEDIKTVEDWENFRRPEIMNLLSEYIYGVRPVDRPSGMEFKIAEEKKSHMGHKMDYQKIIISFMGYSFVVHAYLPQNIEGKIPAFVYDMHEYQEERFNFETEIECANIDFDEITKRGYGIFVMPTSGIYPDWEHKSNYKDGVFTVFPPNGEREDNAWATISAWSWGLSRVIDYLETLPYIDIEKIAAVGHSRGGKTALWCGATDKRVACAISNNSGTAGAAMHRNKVGEHIKDINITDWFCKNYHKFNDREEFLPVDQHMLIASLAPRLCYVSSSSNDDWADPEAERRSCRLASEVYEMYGKKGVVLPDEPVEIEKAYHEGSIGYHSKPGDHGITHYDWKMFLDFLDSKWK